jgi:glycosyltransferase involved in cell wall biosynthesis
LKVLISAYACEPDQGSEPGVGWNFVCQMAGYHELWVITRANNRAAIEAELGPRRNPRLHFVYFDLPPWALWWKKRKRGLQVYYYVWQIAIYFVARRLQRRVKFDLVHHLTFGKYWSPSFLSLLPVPFLWGPVGGGESAPKGFRKSFGLRGLLAENLREIGRSLAEYDPFIRITVKRSDCVLTKAPETSARVKKLGARRVVILGESAISRKELEIFRNEQLPSGVCRFISVANLLHWKGFHLGLQAFAQAQLPSAEYWIIGDGPELKRLQTLARNLGIAERVIFFGRLPRRDTLQRIQECQVLVHPSLHDSGGWVCLEGMACGLPVVCLDLGGPATQVTAEVGFKISSDSPACAVAEMARAMDQLARDDALRTRMAQAARHHIETSFTWERKAEALNHYYAAVAAGLSDSARPSRAGAAA